MKKEPAAIANEVTPIFNVKSFKDSIQYYKEVLLFEVDWEWGDPPTFGSIRLDQAAIFLCEQGQGAPGTWVSLFLDDLDTYHEKISKSGAEIIYGPRKEPWGCKELHVRDLDQHVIRFSQMIPETEPKIEVKRVDFSARIESRLANVIKDLAAHKGMIPGELLEETFLHSFEEMGKDAVASPHSRNTLKFIEDLKIKHGLDYDTHASYRFIEKANDKLDTHGMA